MANLKVENNHYLTLDDKEFKTLQNMILDYKEVQEELYDYPEPDTLFTKTQRHLFDILLD